MIQILLNNTEVYPKQGQTIKMTKENPALTKSGTYSLDIEFPFDVPANRIFFGALNRTETRKGLREYTVTIRQDNTTIVSGTAVMTKSSDASVTMQVLAGASAKVEDSNMKEVYIDEMSLGLVEFVPGDMKWDVYYTGGNKQRPFTPIPDWGIEIDYSKGEFVRDTQTHGFLYAFLPLDGKQFVGNEDIAIFTPVYDETNQADRNITRLYQTEEQGPFTVVQRMDTPQPNLMFMVKNIFQMMGYSVNLGIYGEKPYTRMYIANAHPTQALSYTLPHWTVNEFIEQLQLFLDCIIEIDYIGKTVTLQANGNVARKSEQLEIVDAFEAEIEQGDDVSEVFTETSNLSYDLSDSADHIYDRLTDDVLKAFEIKEYKSYQEMKDAYEASNDSVKAHAIFKCPDGYYCRGYINMGVGTSESNYRWTLLKVHLFGDYITNEETKDKTKVKICPVAITEYNSWWESLANVYNNRKDFYTLQASLKNERATGNKGTTVWEGITEGVEDVADTPPEDRLQVFFFDGVTSNGKIYDHPVMYPNPWVDHEYMNVYEGNQPICDRPSWSLSMDPNNNAEFTMAKLHTSLTNIDRRTQHTFRFLSTTPPDVSQVFLVKGKKYLCEKVEYDIEDDGINPLMTGYFYEITE